MDDDIDVLGLKKCLQYLRCFGPFIHGLSIDYDKSMSTRYKYVHEYVNEFCAESLVCMTFTYLPDLDIEQFRKVFAKIEDVSFVCCELGEKWPSFVQSFSNLRYLSLSHVHMDYRFVEKPFQNLEHLRINRIRCDGINTIKIAADLLDGIRQLKSLKIDTQYKTSMATLLDLIKENNSIVKLTVLACPEPATSADVQRLVHQHPALIDLNLLNYKFTLNDVNTLINQHGSLKKLKFYTECRYGLLSDFCLEIEDEWQTGVRYIITYSSNTILSDFEVEIDRRV